MTDDVMARYGTYDKDHCWQYDIRVNNRKRDLEEVGLIEEDVSSLRTSDFSFRPLETKGEKATATEFIKRHEWLGTISLYTTHWFGCFYGDTLAGVMLFNMPNAFSKLLGENTKQLERLISRGACISWSPKNLASYFLSWSIKWMVQNTQYRLFTAYSDPEARELGTVYQASNFYYLGQKSGTTKRYINPYTGKYVSDRFFRVRSAYKKYAKELGIVWQKDWNSDTGMLWDNIPDEHEKALREMSKKKQSEAKYITLKPKHKYCFILGRDKKETKQLRKAFLERNKVFPYPKNRGGIG